MKALLITGTLAENTVKQYAKQSNTPAEVLTIKISVAALLNPQTIIQALQKIPLNGIDIILTPGQILGDTKVITEMIRIPTFKGPRYAADLPAVLDSLPEVTLSTVLPACDLLGEKLKQKALAEIEKVEQNRKALLKKPSSILIGDLPIGKEFPMRVLAEIVDAPLLETDEIKRLARRYVRSGADIIDVGMLAGQSKPLDAKRAIAAVKNAVDVPVSIDTLDPLEIKAAVAAGIDLILSADEGNLTAIAPFAKGVPIVIIPSNQRKGFFPKSIHGRVKMLERLINKAKVLGFRRIIGDLVLEPSDILGSFVAFREFRHRNPNIPLLIGIANVVELFDADSVGLNALLARISSEVDAGILLVTEKSPKTRGTVREASIASKMMFLAKKRASVPKDLGIDLLVLKNKLAREIPFNMDLQTDSNVTVKSERIPYVDDSTGSFRIMVDREAGYIVAIHYESSDMAKPLRCIRGGDAETVLAEILGCGLVSRLDHAAYLGRELAKAEVALKVGRDYVQDAELFKQS